MKITHVNLLIDCAGASINLHNALNKYTHHESRHIVGTSDYPAYEHGVLLSDNISKGFEYLKQSLIWCDIAHFHLFDWNTKSVPIKLNEGWIELNFSVSEHIKGKKLVFSEHGGWTTHFSTEYKNGLLYKKYSGKARVVACSPKNLVVYENSVWLPNIIPEQELLYTPVDRDFSGVLKVCHTPSSREFKDTGDFIQVIDELKKEGYPVEMVLVEQMPNRIALKAKRRCHLCFDNYTHYPGTTSLEALSQGVVSLSTTSREIDSAFEKIVGAKLPVFFVSDKNSLKEALIYFLNNRKQLRQMCEESRRWVEEYYSGNKIIKLWSDFYERVVDVS